MKTTSLFSADPEMEAYVEKLRELENLNNGIQDAEFHASLPSDEEYAASLKEGFHHLPGDSRQAWEEFAKKEGRELGNNDMLHALYSESPSDVQQSSDSTGGKFDALSDFAHHIRYDHAAKTDKADMISREEYQALAAQLRRERDELLAAFPKAPSRDRVDTLLSTISLEQFRAVFHTLMALPQEEPHSLLHGLLKERFLALAGRADSAKRTL